MGFENLINRILYGKRTELDNSPKESLNLGERQMDAVKLVREEFGLDSNTSAASLVLAIGFATLASAEAGSVEVRNSLGEKLPLTIHSIRDTEFINNLANHLQHSD